MFNWFEIWTLSESSFTSLDRSSPDKTLTVCLFVWDASTLYFYNYLHSASNRRWTHTTVQIFHYVKIFRTCSLLPHSPAFHNNLILWHIWFFICILAVTLGLILLIVRVCVFTNLNLLPWIWWVNPSNMCIPTKFRDWE